KARLDKELRTAAEMQRMLLSRTVHLGAFCESVGDSMPCRAIGGDFFEIVELAAGNIGMVMGDVAGTGPAAALVAALLQAMFTAEAAAGGGPGATLARLDTLVAARHLDRRLATPVL